MPSPTRCCGSPLQVIPLRAGPDGPVVELLRCRRCTRSHWRAEGTDVTRSQAFEALGPRAAPAARPVPATRARRAASAAPVKAAELRELLSGWQVLGS